MVPLQCLGQVYVCTFERIINGSGMRGGFLRRRPLTWISRRHRRAAMVAVQQYFKSDADAALLQMGACGRGICDGHGLNWAKSEGVHVSHRIHVGAPEVLSPPSPEVSELQRCASCSSRSHRSVQKLGQCQIFADDDDRPMHASSLLGPIHSLGPKTVERKQ